ncbi:hypothetical protein NUU61_003259 [Penicillium alfredii]|uniref:Uncharacterized protein n=1 Tax=Penicillium alfredii TaxID=1506179 RepID=A0A9W9FT86_9EURO|nr:uncharacterized protein NUU61_003259 [Penicillium alfredii]KAJ5105912.1 hypothetical protein NUU61_003259 [Penicillium alfredii]
MSLSGQVILITGSSQGIGEAAALRLASEGASLVINYFSNADGAQALVEQIGSERAVAVKADASKLSDLDHLVDAAVAKFGKIDVVVPNAGLLLMRDVESTTEEDFDQTYNLMVKGPYFLVQKAVKHMPPGGRIIFLSSSVTAFSGILPPYLLYASAKGAIEQMTRLMAKDLARKGITVNTVAPGPTATELFFKGKSEQVLKACAAFSPFNRIGEPDEIVGAMAFLCGKDSRWVSGQIIRVNGGMA